MSPASTTMCLAPRSRKRSITTCEASDSISTCMNGSSRVRLCKAPASGARARATCAVPRTTVPPNLIERALA